MTKRGAFDIAGHSSAREREKAPPARRRWRQGLLDPTASSTRARAAKARRRMGMGSVLIGVGGGRPYSSAGKAVAAQRVKRLSLWLPLMGRVRAYLKVDF